jgi:predicted ATPase
VFIGASGSGKSTLLNALVPRDTQESVLESPTTVFPRVSPSSNVYKFEESFLRAKGYGYSEFSRTGENLYTAVLNLHREQCEQGMVLDSFLTDLFPWFTGELKVKNGMLSIGAFDPVLLMDCEMTQEEAPTGFLIACAYLVLMLSKHTPKWIAIEGLGEGLSPSLARRLARIVFDLAKVTGKTIYVSTSTPAVLDAINLAVDMLGVLYRGRKGIEVEIIKAEFKPVHADGESMPLSLAYTRGYLGGLDKY